MHARKRHVNQAITALVIAAASAGAQPPPVTTTPGPAAPGPTTPGPTAPGAPSLPADPASGTPAPATPPASVASASVQAALKDHLADWLTRVAMVDLRVNPQARERDYEAAALLLAEAWRLRPADQTILRLAIDAATQGGDEALAQRLTAELVRLDPKDTKAQLSLISARVADRQTVEARLELLDRFLGPAGQALDPSIRSRLALDAALLHRVRGDVEGFAKRLGDATALDVTNKDAAALAYTFFAQRVEDAPGRMELLVNLLKADPIDPATHHAIARLLSEHGAYAGAKRFLLNSARLRQALQMDIGPGVTSELIRHDLFIDGADKVIRQLTDQLNAPRREIEAAIEEARSRGAPTDQFPDPQSYRLSPDLEMLRLIAASAVGQSEIASESILELVATVKQYGDWVTGAKRRPASISEESAKRELDLWAPEILWLRAWTGLLPDKLEADVTDALGNAALAPAAAHRLKAFMLIRAGKLDQAADLVRAMEGDPFADIARGLVLEAQGDETAAAEAYAQAAKRFPGTLQAAWGGLRAMKLTGAEQFPAPEEAATLQAMAQGVPVFFDQFIEKPQQFMGLQVEPAARSVGPTDRALLNVRILNRSPIPLAVGGERAVNARLLLSAETDVAGVRSLDTGLPEVVMLDRRLRLLPREEITATIWADPGFAAWSLASTTGENILRRFRLLQGFVLNDAGVPRRGGLCLEAEGKTLLRAPLAHLRDSDEALAGALKASRGADWVDALLAARVRLLTTGSEGGLDPLAARTLVDAALERYRSGEASERALVLLIMPTGLQNSIAADFDRAVRDLPDADPLVVMVKALTRVTDAADPTLAAAIASADDRVARLGAALKARLSEAGARGYSRLTSVKATGTSPVE